VCGRKIPTISSALTIFSNRCSEDSSSAIPTCSRRNETPTVSELQPPNWNPVLAWALPRKNGVISRLFLVYSPCVPGDGCPVLNRANGRLNGRLSELLSRRAINICTKGTKETYSTNESGLNEKW